jgi:hypothetical protein
MKFITTVVIQCRLTRQLVVMSNYLKTDNSEAFPEVRFILMSMGFFSYQLVFLLTIFMALNATAADAPKTDDKKKLQSWPPERLTRPKPTLPQPNLMDGKPAEKSGDPAPCNKFEYKESSGKIQCMNKALGSEKPNAKGK